MPNVSKRVIFDYGGKTLISLAPDKNRLCVANKHGLTKILKVNNPEEEPEVLETLKRPSFIRCDSTNGFLLGTVDGDVMRYHYEGGASSLVVRYPLPVRDCCVVHSGKMGVFGGDDLELSFVELLPQEGGNPQRYKIKLDEQVHQMSYSPGTNLLSVSMINGRIQFYSLNSTQPNKVHEIVGEIPKVAYEDVVDAGGSNGLLSDILSSDSEMEGGHPGDDGDRDSLGGKIKDPEFTKENRVCTRVAWHPTGLYFAIPCENGLIKLYSVKNYSQLKVLKADSNSSFTNLEFDPIHGNALVATDLDNRVTIWDWQDSKVLYSNVNLKIQLTNLVWKCQQDNTGKSSIELIMGSWSGSTVTISDLESIILANLDSKKSGTTSTTKPGSSLFIDDEEVESDSSYNANGRLGLVDRTAQEDNDELEFLSNDDDDDDDAGLFTDKPETGNGITERDSNKGDSEGLFTQNRDEKTLKRKRQFNGSGYAAGNIDDDDDDGFVDDDDGMGYAEPHIHRKRARKHGMVPSLSIPGPGKFHYKPFSPGATPFGGNDRRYLTMNGIGYVSTVKNSEQYSITVSFFDIGKYNEYHFEDLFGYDLCSLTELGTLYAHSKLGQVYYRPHDNIYSSWTKLIPLKPGERITAIAATPKRVIVGTSLGYIRFFNPFGLPVSIEKMSPIVAIAAQEYKVFIVHYSPYHGISYSLCEYSPNISQYFQKEEPLPLALPHSQNDYSFTGIEDIDRDILDMDYEAFNPLGIKNLFFSTYGDPCIFGHDNVLLILDKWRSTLESRWVPILDTDFEIWKATGKGRDSGSIDVHAWPLGLSFDTLSCILVKGKRFWPEFPLPLPSEMAVRVPVLVKSQLLEKNKTRLQGDKDERETEDENGLDGSLGNADDDKAATKELEVPVSMAAEEEFIRSTILASLLRDTLENDGEVYGNERDILTSLNGARDKSLLRLFAVACTNQDSDKAMSIAKELRQDRALAAAAKIAERAEMLTLIKRVNDLRETKFAREH